MRHSRTWHVFGILGASLLLPLPNVWGQAPPGPVRPAAQERERREQPVQARQPLSPEVHAGQSAEDKSGVKRFTLLDLQPYANQKLRDSMGSGSRPANTLIGLPSGRQQFLKIPFDIGEGLLQLGSTELRDKPEQIKAIKVGLKLRKLHFLHAAVFYLEEETPIGRYTVHYVDGTTETIPIVNAKDVSDWWKYAFAKQPTQGRVAWQGANAAAKEFKATLQLFLSSWVNPRANVAVTEIDYASTMQTCCGPFCVAITAEQPATEFVERKFGSVDLQPKANQKLTDNFGRLEGNNLASLPRGERTFVDVPFQIGESFLQLGSELMPLKPERMEGIPVGKAFTRLHILHATVFGRGDPAIADDTLIAKYEIHCASGNTETIPVVYGKDVRDWWYSADEQSVARGKVAWNGENEVTKNKAGFQRPPAGIRLYLSTWENPQPTQRVVCITYQKVGNTPAAPFCVALTTEEVLHVRAPFRPVGAEELEKLWKQLASEADQASAAMETLAAAPQQALPFFRAQVRTLQPAATEKRIGLLLTRLEDDNRAVREQASRELEQLGREALPQLQWALIKAAFLEVRHRLEPLVEEAQRAPLTAEQTRWQRVLQVCEWIGTAEARQVLHEIAKGSAGAWLAPQAEASLQRLEKTNN